nr:unnamed protein product [Callosobruchus analis]
MLFINDQDVPMNWLRESLVQNPKMSYRHHAQQFGWRWRNHFVAHFERRFAVVSPYTAVNIKTTVDRPCTLLGKRPNGRSNC